MLTRRADELTGSLVVVLPTEFQGSLLNNPDTRAESR
jgi:hypothetical protein